MNTTLIFFGSGPVAAASLKLLGKTFEIEAIITKPSTEWEMSSSCPNTPVHTVSDKKELDELLEKEDFSSQIGVLIDFGIIVSSKAIDSFKLGIVNSHFSLLPELRGADPISFAILEGKKVTGVSLMLLVEAMDEGPLLSQSKLNIGSNETSSSLTDRLVDLSYESLKTTLPLWIEGEIQPADQSGVTIANTTTPTYTRKLNKQDGEIDWTKPAKVIEREIRAFNDWPKSHTKLGDVDIIVIASEVIDVSGAPGNVFVHDKNLVVSCGEDSLLIKELKPAGKKQMGSQAFLAGYKTRIGL